MQRCNTCHGFIPTGAPCPNCATGGHAAWPRWLKATAVMAGCAAMGVTLSACYGAPCVHEGGGQRMPQWDANGELIRTSDDGDVPYQDAADCDCEAEGRLQADAGE